MNGDDPNDDLNDQERLIADAARRMQSRGVSDTDIDGFIQRAQERLAQNVADRPLSRGQLAKGMARGVAQGVTFNFADELEGLARGLLTDETRAEATEKVRGEQNEFRGKEPGLAFASEMAGSLVPGVGAARMAMKGVRPGARLAGRIAASGAGAGALAGAGAGEGGVGSGVSAAAGAAGGAILGYAGGKAIGGLQRSAPAVKKIVRPGAKVVQPTAAARKLAGALEDAEKTAADLTNAAPDSPETMVVDVLGKPGARQARSIRTLGGKPGEAIERTLAERQTGQQQRVIKRLYGKRGREDVFRTADELAEEQLQASKPIYEAAYAHGAVDDPAINKILQSGAGGGGPHGGSSGIAKLWNKARAIAQQEALAAELGGEPAGYVMPTIEELTAQQAKAALTGELETVVSSRGRAVPDVKALDYLKQAMDDEIEALAAQPNARRAMVNLRERLLNRLDDIVPNYRAARGIYAGKARLREALENGKAALKRGSDPREIAREIADMGPSERALYQRGAIDALRTDLEEVGNHIDLAKRLNNTAFKARVRAVYGEEAEDVLKMLAAEAQMAETGAFIRGGSQTADKAAEAIGMSGEVGDALQHFAGGIGFGSKAAVRRVLAAAAMGPMRRSIAGATEGTRGELADLLTTKLTEQAKLSPFLEMLKELERRQPLQRVGRAVGGSAAGRIVGRAMGQP